MKELLEKFFGIFSDGVSLLKEEKPTEAIKKFEEASEMKTKISKEVSDENNSTPEENLKKFFESDDWKEAIKKYVDMYLSSDDVTKFMEQIKELTWKVKKIETDKKTDDETIEKALNEHWEEIDEIKKILSNQRISKID